MRNKLKLSLTRLNPLRLLALLMNVIAKMKGNLNFATPAVPLADMETLRDTFAVAIEEATNGSRQSRLKRDDLVVAVQQMLQKQAAYVTSVCGGDRTMLESSGFELANLPEPIEALATPKNLETRMTGLPGEVELVWRSVYGAHGYHVWMNASDPNDEAGWKFMGYTARVRRTLGNLESYKPYWFCVNAVGFATESAKSDPAVGRAA